MMLTQWQVFSFENLHLVYSFRRSHKLLFVVFSIFRMASQAQQPADLGAKDEFFDCEGEPFLSPRTFNRLVDSAIVARLASDSQPAGAVSDMSDQPEQV